MAYIYADVEVSIDVDDFLDACSKKEKEQLIKSLKQSALWSSTQSENVSVLDSEWNEVIEKLTKSRLQLTNEEEEIIKKIANKL